MSDGFHDSMFQLLDLLGDYQSDPSSIEEEDFQLLFENSSHIWAVLGYSNLIPQPKCELIVEEPIQGDFIEPDFIAYNKIRERWEIVDLKLPKQSVRLEHRNRRKRFKSEIEDYISQVQEYSDYFSEKSHREFVKSEHGAEVPRKPPVVLIVGSNLDQSEINQYLKKYSHDISIVQYDKILDLLRKKFVEDSGERGSLPGITIASRMTLLQRPQNDREYIFDISKQTDSPRLSLYLTNYGDLVLEITTESELNFSVDVPWDNVLRLGEQKVLYLEFATTEKMSIARVFAGSEILDEMILTMQVPFSGISDGPGFQGVEDDFDLYFGANREGKKGAVFLNQEIVILSKLESLDERLRFMRYLQKKSNEDYQGVFFDRDVYAYTKESSDLEQGEDSEEMVFWDNQQRIQEYVQDHNSK